MSKPELLKKFKCSKHGERHEIRVYAADKNSKSPQKGEAKIYHVRVR